MTILTIALLLCNSALTLYLFFQKRVINSPFQFFYLLLFGLVIAPGFFDLSPEMRQFHPWAPPLYVSADLVFNAHLVIAAILLLFALFERILPFGISQPIELPPLRVGLNIYDLVFVSLIAALLFGIYLYGFGKISNATFGDLRGGALNTFSLIMFYLQALIIGLPGVYWIKARRKLAASLVMGVFVLIFLTLGGSRQALVLSVMVFPALYMAKNDWKRGIGMIAIITIGFTYADSLLQILKALRNLPSMDARYAMLGQILGGNFDFDKTSSETGVRYVMYAFLTEKPPSDFGHLDYFVRSLLFWMPSAIDIADIKPDDFEYKMFAQAMSNHSGTMHATFFGSIYADGRYFSAVWVAWIAAIFKITERIILRMQPLERLMVWSACIATSFMAARGSLYAPLVILSLTILLASLSRLFNATLKEFTAPLRIALDKVPTAGEASNR